MSLDPDAKERVYTKSVWSKPQGVGIPQIVTSRVYKHTLGWKNLSEKKERASRPACKTAECEARVHSSSILEGRPSREREQKSLTRATTKNH